MDLSDALSLFVNQPWWALAVSVPLMALYAWQKQSRLLIAGLGWLAYFLYELLIFHGAICPEGCNIRVELIVLYPMLLALTLTALFRLVKQLLRNRRS